MDLNINVFDTITIFEALPGNPQRKEIYYVDYINGASGNTGRSWAQAKKRIDDINTTNVSEIMIAKSPDPVSIGSATFTENTAIITLATEKTKVIDMFG